MRPDIAQLLDEALERLRAGASIEECLSAYPAHAAELEPMLRTAAAIQRQASADLPPSLEQWLASGRNEIEELARASYARRETLLGRLGAFFRSLSGGLFSRGGPRMASVALSALIICFMTFYTVDAAAAGSLPGDYLYGWKLFSEQARISLAANPDRRAQLVAASVERRVAEIGALAERERADPGQLAQTVDRLNSQVVEARSALDSASPEVRQRAMARIGRLLVRAESDLRSAAPADEPAAEAIESAADEVAVLIDDLPAEPEVDGAAVVPAPDATPESIEAAESSPEPAGGAAPASTLPPAEVATPIRAPAGDGPSTQPSPGAPPTATRTSQSAPAPTLSPTPSGARTAAPTRTATPPDRTPVASPSRTPVVAPTRSPTQPLPTTAAETPLPTSTPVATSTPVPPIDAPTVAPSNTPVPTATSTPQPIDTPQPTATSTPEPTDTPVPTATSTPEPTASDTPRPTATSTPEPTDTPRPTATSTPEPTDTPRLTATSTPEPTDTPRPTATSTPEPTDTPRPTATSTPEPDEPGLRPILECVAKVSDGVYVAYFGYRNTTLNPIELEIGYANQFSPEPIDRGQPTFFPVGRSDYYPNALFSVVFDGTTLVWKLDKATATASRSSESCPS